MAPFNAAPRAVSAAAIAGAARKPSIIAPIGDSRIDQTHVDAARRRKTAHGMISWALALSGQRATLAGNWGLSGDRTDQMLARLDAAIASGAGLLLIHAGVNDLAQSIAGYTASVNGPYAGQAVTVANVGAVAFANIRFAAEKARLAGMRIILVYEPGQAAGMTTATIGQLLKLNRLLKDYARATPEIYGFDLPALMWDPLASTTTTLAFKSGFYRNASGDVLTHHTILGAHVAAKGDGANPGLAELISRLVPPRSVLPASPFEIPSANDATNLLLNPLFTAMTGGTKTPNGGAITGNAPGGWTVSVASGAPTVDISYADSATGVGKDLVLAITATTATDSVRVEQTAGAGYWAAGDILQGVGRAAIAAGSSNLSRCGVQLDCNNDGATLTAEDLWADGTRGNLPTAAMDLTLCTERLVVPAFTTKGYVVPYYRVGFSAAGAATVRFSQCQTQKLTA